MSTPSQTPSVSSMGSFTKAMATSRKALQEYFRKDKLITLLTDEVAPMILNFARASGMANWFLDANGYILDTAFLRKKRKTGDPDRYKLVQPTNKYYTNGTLSRNAGIVTEDS